MTDCSTSKETRKIPRCEGARLDTTSSGVYAT